MDFVADARVVKEHAQRGHCETKEKVDTPARRLPLTHGRPVLSAWVAERCYPALGQKLAGEAARVRADLERRAEKGNWAQGHSSKSSHLCKWALRPSMWLTWKQVGGKKTVKARLIVGGYQDPDL